MKHQQSHPYRIPALLLLSVLTSGAMADWGPAPVAEIAVASLVASAQVTPPENDLVLVNQLAYDLKVPLTQISLARLSEPQRGDMVTLLSPRNQERLVKRVAAVPGDLVELRGSTLYVNHKPAGFGAPDEKLGTPAPHADDAVRSAATQASQKLDKAEKLGFGPTQLPADRYFVLGDNPDDTEDSRFFGLVAREGIVGRTHHVVLSTDLLGGWAQRLERGLSVFR
ncbi:signal peptidase I [Ideonella azotifigens]|uniref:Signal peptidase I n=1 Tax=Ideonella azotifigens TaxID=513160 RepID=A0ABN1KEG8_9BURK|nr:signal peptidase I [Ideonella azotifigens]MCD2340750.1 signal peptidase I [Ideonella azotifigens]